MKLGLVDYAIMILSGILIVASLCFYLWRRFTFVHEVMSPADKERVKAIQIPKYTIFPSELNPKEWIINRNKNIYLIY